MNRFIKTMMERKLTLALAESMTCGFAAYLLATNKGTSEVLRGSVVCYHASVKKSLLSVSDKLLQKHTAESRQATDAIARGLKKHIRADVYASLTGLASNGGSERKGKPVGTVFFTVLYRNRRHISKKTFRGAPGTIREKACLYLYELIIRHTAAEKSR